MLVEPIDHPRCQGQCAEFFGQAQRQSEVRVLAGGAQLIKHRSAPTLLEAVKSRTDEPIDAADRRWLDAQRTATLEQSLADVICSMLLGQHLLGEPGDQLVPIQDGCLAEAQKLANLSAVVFDRAAGPLVARVQICRCVDLVGDVAMTALGMSCVCRGKRASSTNALSRTAKPRRVAPVLWRATQVLSGLESNDLPTRRVPIATSSGPPSVQLRWLPRVARRRLSC